MATINIYHPDGDLLTLAILEASSSQDWSLMGDNKLSLSFRQYTCAILPAGAWCELDGVRFFLLQEYKPTMIHSQLWQYNVILVDSASWLGITTALKTIDGEDMPLFTLTAPAVEHAEIIVANLNRRLGTTAWKVGSVIDTPNITIEYTGKYCSDVLQDIVDGQNTEWWIDGTTLNIGRAEFGSRVEMGYRDGLLGDISVSQADNMSAYRTLYPVGSTRNILPTKYGHDRLQLPNGQKSVMMNPAGVAELVEEAAFADIYPRYEGSVTDVITSIGSSDDGSQYIIYHITDSAIPFNPNDYEMPGLVKRITFLSGELMGAEFDVNYIPASHEFELITQFQTDGSQLPGGLLVPQVGDKYVVWNISMPDEYYPLAEQELLEAAETFAASSIRESNVYKVKLDYIDVQERGLSLRPGRKVRLHSADYFPELGYYDSRITRMTRPINNPGEYTIDVSAVRVVGSLSRLQTSLKSTTAKVNNLSNAVQTVVQTIVNAVTLTGNQRIAGEKNFVDGIRVNSSPLITYDEKTNTLLLKTNLALLGGVASRTALPPFSIPTIMDGVSVDDQTIIKEGGVLRLNPDLELGGGGLVEEELREFLNTNNYVTTSDVSTTLQGYATVSSLNALSSRFDDFLAGADADAIINKWSELEVFLSGLSESDNLATILATKANKSYVDSTFFPLAGGTIRGTTTINQTGYDDGLILNRTVASSGAAIRFQTQGTLLGKIGINGSGLMEVVDSSNAVKFCVNLKDGNVGIGTTAPSTKLHVAGNIRAEDSSNPFLALKRGEDNWYVQVTSSGIKIGKGSAYSINVDASGNFTSVGGVTGRSTSDKRLKKNFKRINASGILMSLGDILQFEYIDSEVKANHIYEGKHIGLIYQNVVGTALNRMCIEREDGYGSLNYLEPSFISLLAGVCQELVRENNMLKERLDLLERRG